MADHEAGLKRWNPMTEVNQMGRLSAIPDDVPEETDLQIKVRYEVYNVNDPAEKQMLCDAKSLIISKGYPFLEKSTFDQEGNWIVALNWNEDPRPGS